MERKEKIALWIIILIIALFLMKLLGIFDITKFFTVSPNGASSTIGAGGGG